MTTSRSLEIRELVRGPVAVSDAEYWRLLGYPGDAGPGEQALELAQRAREWYGRHGRPWIYLREVALTIAPTGLFLDGVEFPSRRLHAHLRQFEARRALVVAISAGAEPEAESARLWQESKPDEYFFTEVFASAVVEQLAAELNARICTLAETAGLLAIPHYSPGYAGWHLADQTKLFDLIGRGAREPMPGPLQLLPGGMLKPRQSLLAVVGLAPRTAGNLAASRHLPCERCSFSPCRYRRKSYQPAVKRRPETGVRRPPVLPSSPIHQST